MSRLTKIILIILFVVATILVVGWLRVRHNAQQAGKPVPTFRQFLGLGSTAAPQTTTGPNGSLTSDFTNGGDVTATEDTSTGSAGTVATTQFTSGPLSPTQSNSPQTSSNGTGHTNNQTPSSTPTAPAGSGPTPTAPAPAAQCSDTDLNIQFTPEEITRLNALQNRFYAVAGMLHTDGDVQNEVANYNQFKAKSDQITELYNYCASVVPQITNPLYTSRVSTPYWRDANRDGVGYVSNKPNGWSWIQLTSQAWNPRSNPLVTQGLIEQIFRVNLW